MAELTLTNTEHKVRMTGKFLDCTLNACHDRDADEFTREVRKLIEVLEYAVIQGPAPHA